jgi:predicted acetyltransferase
MNYLELRPLRLQDESLFLDELLNWNGEDLSWYSIDWPPGASFAQMIERLDKNRRGIDVPEDFVPATMLYGFLKLPEVQPLASIYQNQSNQQNIPNQLSHHNNSSIKHDCQNTCQSTNTTAIVGYIHIRHHLNENLNLHSGHIGYAIAPKYRRQGYATQLMNLALAYCRDHLGLKRILITCSDANAPSIRIIEKVGGILENKVPDLDQQLLIRRYWLEIL